MYEQLQEDIKAALRSKEELKLEVLRNIKAEITNELVKQGKKPTDALSDEEILSVISRLSKQRKDSIEQFEDAGRNDLADKEKKELIILEEYLPEQLSDEELEQVVEKKKEELGITDMSGMGQLMGAVMSEVKTQADGGMVKNIVQKLLQ